MVRRNSGPVLVIIYWRDIPAQVNGINGEVREQRILPARFQQAIDKAAVNAGLTTAGDYTSEFRRETRPCGPDVVAEAIALAQKLEDDFPRQELAKLVARCGVGAHE